MPRRDRAPGNEEGSVWVAYDSPMKKHLDTPPSLLRHTPPRPPRPPPSPASPREPRTPPRRPPPASESSPTEGGDLSKLARDRWGDCRVFDDGVPVPSRWCVAAAARDAFDEVELSVPDGGDAGAPSTPMKRAGAPRAPSPTDRTCAVHFLDGSRVDVDVSRDDKAVDVVNALAGRLGIAASTAGALTLYVAKIRDGSASMDGARLEQRVPPNALMAPLCSDRVGVVAAVRLFTAPLHEAALRALRGGDGQADDRAAKESEIPNFKGSYLGHSFSTRFG